MYEIAFSRIMPLFHFTGLSSSSSDELLEGIQSEGRLARRALILVFRFVRYFFSIRLCVFRLHGGLGEEAFVARCVFEAFLVAGWCLDSEYVESRGESEDVLEDGELNSGRTGECELRGEVV